MEIQAKKLSAKLHHEEKYQAHWPKKQSDLISLAITAQLQGTQLSQPTASRLHTHTPRSLWLMQVFLIILLLQKVKTQTKFKLDSTHIYQLSKQYYYVCETSSWRTVTFSRKKVSYVYWHPSEQPQTEGIFSSKWFGPPPSALVLKQMPSWRKKDQPSVHKIKTNTPTKKKSICQFTQVVKSSYHITYILHPFFWRSGHL